MQDNGFNMVGYYFSFQRMISKTVRTVKFCRSQPFSKYQNMCGVTDTVVPFMPQGCEHNLELQPMLEAQSNSTEIRVCLLSHFTRDIKVLGF